MKAAGGRKDSQFIKSHNAIFFDYHVSSVHKRGRVLRFQQEAHRYILASEELGVEKTYLKETDVGICLRFLVYFRKDKNVTAGKCKASEFSLRHKVAFHFGDMARSHGIRVKMHEQPRDTTFLDPEVLLKASCTGPPAGRLPLRRLGLNPLRGHPLRPRVPYSCDVENCEVGGCAISNIGQTMVRVEPADRRFIDSNPPWGGVHLTMTSFDHYPDPYDMFARFRKMFGPEYCRPWAPRKPSLRTISCSGVQSTRLEFKSKLLEDIAHKLDTAGFKAKHGNRHISVEECGESDWIVGQLSTEKEFSDWNVVLVGVEGGEVVKMASWAMKYNCDTHGPT